MTPPQVSPGLAQILQRYCAFRKWHTVSPETVLRIRELIERAGSVEEADQGLSWFFQSKYVDDWIENERPNLGLPFITQNFERFEIDRAERAPRTNGHYFSGVNEYRLLRAGI